ncbi:hypothetical protein [Methylobacterium nodulans]|uniref:Uncharacterized protein n=1 Tax=Methylobacterium nodulans (strain LMG 21967 / CNCM I-2342 / ORS 2060) TaxID=460265 RepID=B8IU89_METNO|nr:hypothetical protein [Methylobacterium nodulans]ACL55134.1 hypothetical protein Mnod_0085 [Methylobacterium nodulans ORS 2060]
MTSEIEKLHMKLRAAVLVHENLAGDCGRLARISESEGDTQAADIILSIARFHRVRALEVSSNIDALTALMTRSR